MVERSTGIPYLESRFANVWRQKNSVILKDCKYFNMFEVHKDISFRKWVRIISWSILYVMLSLDFYHIDLKPFKE